MGLKAVLNEDEFGELEEGQKALYLENDGRFVLDIDGVDDMPAVRSLKNGHTNSKRERDQAKRDLEAMKNRFGSLVDIEDLDLSGADTERFEQVLPWLRGEGDLPGVEGKGKDIDLDKIKENARKPLERERDAAIADRDNMQTQLHGMVRGIALSDGVAEIKVADPFKKAVKAMFRDKVKIVEGEDGQPMAVIDGDYGEQPVVKYLKEWALTDEGKEFIQAPGNNGGGARGSGGASGKIKNPWSPDNWSPTEQVRIFREQGQEVAQRMAQEHGKRVGTER